MKETDLLAAMSFVGEDLIQEAEQKSNKHRPFHLAAVGIIAAALALVIITMPISRPDVENDPISDAVDPVDQPSKLEINWQKNTSSMEADMDLLQETRYDAKIDGYRWPEWSPGGAPLCDAPPLIHLPNQPVTDALTVPAQFAQAAGVCSDDFYPVLQEKFTISSYYILWVRSSPESETHDLAHDHCLELQTESGGTATISVSREGWPLRCCVMESDAPLLSTVRNVEMVIHGMKLTDKTTFFTRFESEGVWYDIETENIGIDELDFLLQTLLSYRTDNPAATFSHTEVCCAYPPYEDFDVGEPNWEDSNISNQN